MGVSVGDAEVTVVCVPRDHYSDVEKSLEALVANTTAPFEWIYVMGKVPRRTRSYLRAKSAEHGFRLVERNEHLTPNQARNIGSSLVETEYTVYLDNDAIVTAGWLEALLGCAKETGAWVVTPLILIGEPEQEAIHTAGGFVTIGDADDPRSLHKDHHQQGRRISEAPPESLVRRPCDFAEFHCMFLRSDTFEHTGALDEHLTSCREDNDLSLEVLNAGGEIWFEPEAVVAFLPPERLSLSEVPYISRRWGERANAASLEHFCSKHDLNTDHIDESLKFMNARRHCMFGALKRGGLRSGHAAPYSAGATPSPAPAPRSRTARRKLASWAFATERRLNRILVRPESTRF